MEVSPYRWLRFCAVTLVVNATYSAHGKKALQSIRVCVQTSIQLQLPWCVTLDQGSHRCDACETPLVRLSLVAQPFQLAFLHPGADEWQHGFGW